MEHSSKDGANAQPLSRESSEEWELNFSDYEDFIRTNTSDALHLGRDGVAQLSEAPKTPEAHLPLLLPNVTIRSKRRVQQGPTASPSWFTVPNEAIKGDKQGESVMSSTRSNQTPSPETASSTSLAQGASRPPITIVGELGESLVTPQTLSKMDPYKLQQLVNLGHLVGLTQDRLNSLVK